MPVVTKPVHHAGMPVLAIAVRLFQMARVGRRSGLQLPEKAFPLGVEILCRRGGRANTVSVYPHHQGIGEPDDGPHSNQPTRRNAC